MNNKPFETLLKPLTTLICFIFCFKDAYILTTTSGINSQESYVFAVIFLLRYWAEKKIWYVLYPDTKWGLQSSIFQDLQWACAK